MDYVIDTISISSFVEAYKFSDQFDLIINVADILEMDKWEKNEYLINILNNQPVLLIPILRYPKRKPEEQWASYSDVWVDLDAMNLVYQNLCSGVDAKKRILIHCMAGQERSPLAIVWYLHKRYQFSIDNGYKWVMEKHPSTQDRRDWLKEMQ